MLLAKNMLLARKFSFDIYGFFSQTFTNHRTAGEEVGISLTRHYHFTDT